MNNIKLKIDLGNEFNQVLGHRYIDEGPFSGQLFYRDFLLPKFEEALVQNIVLEIDLTNVISLPPSFLSESFGKLSTKYGKKKVFKNIKLTAINKERFIQKVNKVIEDPLTFNLS